VTNHGHEIKSKLCFLALARRIPTPFTIVYVVEGNLFQIYEIRRAARSGYYAGRLHLFIMNWFDAQEAHTEVVIPGGEFSFFGEAEFAEAGGCGFQAQDVERHLLQAREVLRRRE